MGFYQQGTSVTAFETFYLVEDDGTFTPADPTTVTFYVRDPTDTLTTYVFGADPEVTNPAVGRYELDFGVPLPPGTYQYRVEGTGDVEAALEDFFTINPSIVLQTASVPGPTSGPCTAWVDVDDIALVCNGDVGSDTNLYQDAADAASQILFELSGRQFSGVCEQTVRPCADGCGCWGWLTSPASPGVPQIPAYSWGFYGVGLGWGWGWGDGNFCGCGTLSRALLPGYPVVEITEVQISGVVLAADEYRLDGNRWLTRMADINSNAQFWPACQRLDLPLGEDGTWGATYRFGMSPPVIGEMAAAQLACELYKASQGQECGLPVGTTQVTRQGITVQRAPFLTWAWKDKAWMTGLALVDAFLSAYNPAGLRRKSSVWSPDLPPYGVRLGTGSGE